MARKNNNMEYSSFYCPRCGNKTFDLLRPRQHIREAFHRKKLYCPTCRGTYNCVECRNQFEVEDFFSDWQDGYYIGDDKELCEID